MWATYARRPLSVAEVQHALAIFPGDTTLDSEGLPDEPTLTNHCAGLVTIDEESKTVRLVHYTAQEYFERILHIRHPQAHASIAATCLAYLSFDVFAHGECKNNDEMKTRLHENCLLDYAAKYWGDHARRGSEDDNKDFVLKFFERQSNLSCSVQVTEFLQGPGWIDSRKFPRGRTGLHVAASLGLKSIVRLLVEGGANVSARDDWGRTALHMAAKEGFADIVRLLLECEDCKIPLDEKTFYTLLKLAMRGGHQGVVRLLLERGDAKAETYLGDETVLTWAADEGYIDLVRLMLASNDVDANSKDALDRTALCAAAQGGCLDVVRLLLEKDDVSANSVDALGRTPLSFAAEGGHEEIARLLLMRENVQADFADLEFDDDGGRTPLSWAAGEGHENIVQLLLARGDVDASSFDIRGSTPLYWAAEQRCEGVLRQLLRSGANIDAANPSRIDAETALGQHAASANDEAVRMLLKYGADIEARDGLGKTAMDRAVDLGHVSVVKLLLEHGARLNIREDGGTTLHGTVYNSQDEWRREDIKRRNGGSKPNVTWQYENRYCSVVIPEPTRMVQITLEDGRTKLSKTPRGGHKEMIGLLLKAGMGIEAKDINGRTALHVAVVEGHEVVTRLLLMNGANVNAIDETDHTALHWAALNGDQAMLEILLENGADVTAMCDDGSALHYAAAHGHEAVLQILLASDAEINAIDGYQMTALS